jgi:hypothetical protein
MDDMTPINPELEMLRGNKLSGFNYRERRHEDWEENYTLYRDKVFINRLTQRQSVNLPLMKQTIRTLLKDVDDMPVLYYENLDNDKEREAFLNEYWKLTSELNHMDLLDIVDKRQVFIFGRSFDQWQIVDGRIKMTIEDPQDILISRYTDPTDIHTSRFLIHTHIFKPLSEIENNPEYDQDAVKRLKQFYATSMGLVKAADNERMLVEKNKRLADMGVDDIDDPVLGETYVELSLHFCYRSNEEDEEKNKLDEQLFLYVECDDMEILMKKPLEQIIGTTSDHFWRNHFPYNSWADDVERQDFWSDGVADIVRTPNKVLNSWFSQEVERRTLSNFGMHYYNSSIEGFAPNTYNPNPWGWYGVPVPPGMRIDDVFKKIDIPLNDGNLESMQFVITMLEKATGATATQQGAENGRQITLGEVQLMLGEAKERIKGMSKFYTPAWQARGRMFLKLIEAAGNRLDAVKIYKKGRNTNDIFEREIEPKDWETPSGYREKVWSQEDKNIQDQEKLQKLNAVKSIMPDNPKLNEIYQRKLLEFADLNPDEINGVMEYEQTKMDALMNQPQMGQPMMGQSQPGQPTPQPQLAAPQPAIN